MEEPFPIHVQQVINGSKVTDHHALLPTKSMANADLAALPALSLIHIYRCVHVIYRKYFENPLPENMPLLEDLYKDVYKRQCLGH